MPTGNVSIRLSLQDVESVRAGLEKLGSDGQAALKKLEAASLAPSHGLSAVDKTVNDLKSRVEDAGKSLGPLGALLTGLGPIGIAAAAGLAVALGIIYEMSKAANELAERSEGIRNFAAATGATTTQVQALVAEGAKFGLTSEQISGGLQRLSVNLAEAKRGTGALYEDLYRINPQLAHQVAAAKDVADAYDLIGKAIKQAQAAQDSSQANQIARAAFGRNPGTQGALAADVSSAGGMNSLAASYQNTGHALDEGLIKRFGQLRVEIRETEQRTKDLTASMFAEDVLQRTLAVDQALERMALHMKEMHDATKDESWGQWFARMGAYVGAGEGGDPTGELRAQIEQETLMSAARRRLQAGLAAGKRSDTDLDKSWQPAGRGQDPSAAVSKVGDAAKETAVPVEAVLADTRKWMAVLGSAATPEEQLKLKVLELAVATKDHAASVQVAARALQAYKDSQTVAAAATREGLGLASQEELLTSGMIKLREDKAKGYIKSAQEMEQAEQRLVRTTEQAYRQEQVANSAFAGLTKMGQGPNVQDIDKLGTGLMDSLSTASVNAMNAVNQVGTAYNTLGLHINATTASSNAAAAAFLNWGRQAVQSIEQVLFKALVLSPLLQAMGFGGSGGGFSFMKTGSGFADGGIMTSMGPMLLRRYADGGVADRPQLAMFGEGRKPEAYVPLPDGRAIPVNLNGASSGGRGHVINSSTNVNVNVPQGASPEDARTMAGHFARQARDMVAQVVDEQIVRHLQSGGMLNL